MFHFNFHTSKILLLENSLLPLWLCEFFFLDQIFNVWIKSLLAEMSEDLFIKFSVVLIQF